MTIVLPPLLSLLGIIFGGVFFGIIVLVSLRVVAVMFMDSAVGTWAAELSVPVGMLSAVGGWIWLWGFL